MLVKPVMFKHSDTDVVLGYAPVWVGERGNLIQFPTTPAVPHPARDLAWHGEKLWETPEACMEYYRTWEQANGAQTVEVWQQTTAEMSQWQEV